MAEPGQLPRQSSWLKRLARRPKAQPRTEGALEGISRFPTNDWDPLKPHEEFRLIILEGRAAGEQLQAKLKCVAFEWAFNKYIAFSYRWDQSFTKSITVDGRTIAITENLHSALSRLRQPKQAIYVWCDAICIKQGRDDHSVLERGQQIPLMGRIYNSALRVVIDLGADDGTLDDALAAINAILRTPQDLRRRHHLEPNPAEYLGLPPFTDPMWSTLETFLSRPWFQRLWCVQEAVLARDIRVIFGKHAVSMEQLIVVASVYSTVCTRGARTQQTKTWDATKASTPMWAAQCFVSTWQMRNARMADPANYKPSLCQMMISTMSQHVTDKRDRVYGMYGMIGPQLANDLPVDYTESTAGLGCRLAEYLIRNGNGVWMLMHCCGLSPSPEQPSWTIDLNKLGARYRADPLHAHTHPDGTNDIYTAGGQSSNALNLRLHSSTGCLAVGGIIVDTVEYMAEPLGVPVDTLFDMGGDYRATPAIMSEVFKWYGTMLQWAQRFPEADIDALWRTLIFNFNPHADDPERETNGRPKAGFRAYFDSLMHYLDIVNNLSLDWNKMTEGEFDSTYPVPPSAAKYWLASIAPLAYRRVVRTQSTRFGLVPDTSQAGDIIVVFHGVPVPFILRPDNHGDGYQVVGVSYIHGLMDGEALQQGFTTRTILLNEKKLASEGWEEELV